MTSTEDAGMTAAEKIRGKIAAIISPTALVINRGRTHGVTLGMRFSVYYSVGPITDPDDPANTIEALNFRKGTVQVTQTYDKMSYCSIDPLRRSQRITSLFPGRFETVADPIYPDVESPMLRNVDTTIKVGDTVEQIEEEKKK